MFSEDVIGKVVFGRVKWFNPKNSFGFITLCNTENDFFVHRNSIMVDLEKYKYLMTGEYVQFVIVDNKCDSKYKYHASKVTGIHGGKLMCETHYDLAVRVSKKDTDVYGMEIV